MKFRCGKCGHPLAFDAPLKKEGRLKCRRCGHPNRYEKKENGKIRIF